MADANYCAERIPPTGTNGESTPKTWMTIGEAARLVIETLAEKMAEQGAPKQEGAE